MAEPDPHDEAHALREARKALGIDVIPKKPRFPWLPIILGVILAVLALITLVASR